MEVHLRLVVEEGSRQRLDSFDDCLLLSSIEWIRRGSCSSCVDDDDKSGTSS